MTTVTKVCVAFSSAMCAVAMNRNDPDDMRCDDFIERMQRKQQQKRESGSSSANERDNTDSAANDFLSRMDKKHQGNVKNQEAKAEYDKAKAAYNGLKATQSANNMVSGQSMGHDSKDLAAMGVGGNLYDSDDEQDNAANAFLARMDKTHNWKNDQAKAEYEASRKSSITKAEGSVNVVEQPSSKAGKLEALNGASRKKPVNVFFIMNGVLVHGYVTSKAKPGLFWFWCGNDLPKYEVHVTEGPRAGRTITRSSEELTVHKQQPSGEESHR